MKSRKCKVCGNPVPPNKFTSMAPKVCGVTCSLKWVKLGNEKKARKRLKEGRESLKTMRNYLPAAQRAFNRFIRARDHGDACISCGGNTGCKMNAGHYLTVAGHFELRFNEDNCNLQCESCNSSKSGNQIKYRIGLIKKRGVERVEFLEGPHEKMNPTIDSLQKLTKYYNRKAREKERENE